MEIPETLRQRIELLAFQTKEHNQKAEAVALGAKHLHKEMAAINEELAKLAAGPEKKA
ncbi:MAG: hypothetical protein ABFE07_29335 [Armatimonadia bacterium]